MSVFKIYLHCSNSKRAYWRLGLKTPHSPWAQTRKIERHSVLLAILSEVVPVWTLVSTFSVLPDLLKAEKYRNWVNKTFKMWKVSRDIRFFSEVASKFYLRHFWGFSDWKRLKMFVLNSPRANHDTGCSKNIKFETFARF